MGTFKTNATLSNARHLLPQIAANITAGFENDGYKVKSDRLGNGGYDISIAKGGIFKAVLGLKTALKVTLLPDGNDVRFVAGVGIWGQQAIPFLITMFVFWPVMITQIWGIVKQAKLDDRALQIARDTIAANS